jgi:trigger factor
VYGKVVELEKGGEPKEGGVTTFVSLEIAKIKNDEIKQQFIGKKSEDKIVFNAGKALDAETIEKSFRLEKEVAKKFKSDVELTLSGVSRITPHEINEELFKKMFPKEEVKDVDTFKKLLKKETEKAYAEQSQMLFNVQVRKALIEQFAGEIPTEFIQRWIASRGEKDVTLDTVKAEWEEKYLPAIKWEFIEAQIRKIKDIDPTQNEIVDYIKGIMTVHDLRKEDEDEKAYEERIEKAARSIAQDRNNVGQIYEKIYSDYKYSRLHGQMQLLRAQGLKIYQLAY